MKFLLHVRNVSGSISAEGYNSGGKSGLVREPKKVTSASTMECGEQIGNSVPQSKLSLIAAT